MSEFKETSVGYVESDSYASFCSNERKWINRIFKLKESHSKDVQIIEDPETNGGVLIAHIPKSWLKINPPKKMNLTEERKAELAARMRGAKNK